MTSEITLLAAALPGWTITIETDSTGMVRCSVVDDRTPRATVHIRGVWRSDFAEAWWSLVDTLVQQARFLSFEEAEAVRGLRDDARRAS